MTKKSFVGVAVLGLAVLVFAGRAFADTWTPTGDVNTNISVSNNNNADIHTKVLTLSNTGGNDASATSGSVGGSSRANGGLIATGNAAAGTDVQVNANNTQTTINPFGMLTMNGDTTTNVSVSNNNSAHIKTDAATIANTGMNTANANSNSVGGSSRARGGMISTGDASAMTTIGVVANTNVTTIQH